MDPKHAGPPGQHPEDWLYFCVHPPPSERPLQALSHPSAQTGWYPPAQQDSGAQQQPVALDSLWTPLYYFLLRSSTQDGAQCLGHSETDVEWWVDGGWSALWAFGRANVWCLVGRRGREKQVFRRWFGMGSTRRPPASSVALGSLLFQAELLLKINNTS